MPGSLQSLVASWLMMGVAFWVAAALLPGVQIRSPRDSLVVAAVFGLVNALLGKALLLALQVLSLGLLGLFVSVGRCLATAVLLMLTSWLTPRLTMVDARSTLACAALVSLLGWLLQLLVGVR